MINRLFITIFALFVLSGFTFLGCSDDEKDSSPGLPAAQDVTLQQLQTLSPATGTGTLPGDKAGTEAAVNNLMGVEGDVTDQIEAIIDSAKIGLKKALKSCSALSLQRIKSDKTRAPQTESDSGSWDEEGPLDLTNYGYASGTAVYDTSGSFSWSDTWDWNETTGIEQWSSQSSWTEYDKLTLSNVVPVIGITLNGYMNQNYSENFNSSGAYDSNTYTDTSLNVNGTMAISYRSGYSMSGTVYTGYVIISADLNGSVNAALNETQLAGLSEEDVDGLIDEYFTVSGSMTVTFYDANGEIVYTQAFTAEEAFEFGGDEK